MYKGDGPEAEEIGQCLNFSDEKLTKLQRNYRRPQNSDVNS